MTTMENSERKVVIFSLSERIFGIDMNALIEIREWEEPTPLPRAPSYIKGVSNLRGTATPVIGLAERLGGMQACHTPAHAPLLSASAGNKSASLWTR